MRPIILITLLFVFNTDATLDLNKIQQMATLKLQTVSDHATQTLHKITDNLDLEKIKQLDFLSIIPRIQDRLNHIHGKKNTVKVYLDKVKTAGNDVLALHSVPWPVHRMSDY